MEGDVFDTGDAAGFDLLAVDPLAALNEIGLSAEAFDDIKKEPLDEPGESPVQEPGIVDYLSFLKDHGGLPGQGPVSWGDITSYLDDHDAAPSQASGSPGQRGPSAASPGAGPASLGQVLEEASNRGRSRNRGDRGGSSRIAERRRQIEEKILANPEASAAALQKLLEADRIEVSHTTILRAQRSLRGRCELPVATNVRRRLSSAERSQIEEKHQANPNASIRKLQKMIRSDGLEVAQGTISKILRDLWDSGKAPRPAEIQKRLSSTERDQVKKGILANPDAEKKKLREMFRSSGLKVGHVTISKIQQDLVDRGELPKPINPFRRLSNAEHIQIKETIRRNPTASARALQKMIEEDGLKVDHSFISRIRKALRDRGELPMPTHIPGRLSEAVRGQIKKKILANPKATLPELREMLRNDGVEVGTTVISKLRTESNQPHHPDIGLHASPVADVANFLARPGNWNEDAGDYAPQVIANALRRELVIHNFPLGSREPHHVPPMPSRGGTSESPVEIVYTGHHYDALVEGRRIPVDPDGDCLFRAVLRSSGREDVSRQMVDALRRSAAQDMRNNPRDYEDFLPQHR